MKKKTLLLFILLAAIVLSSCRSESQAKAFSSVDGSGSSKESVSSSISETMEETNILVSEKQQHEESEQVLTETVFFSATEETPTAPSNSSELYDSEFMNPNDPEIRAEELFGINQALEQLRSLWKEHREELEPIALEMLSLNHFFIEKTGKIDAYCPVYSIRDGISFHDPKFEFSEEVTQRVEMLGNNLEDFSSAWGIMYAYVEGEGWHRIVDSDISSYWLFLYNRANCFYCEVALCYSEKADASVMPFFQVEWLDNHWFLYYEWKE